MDELEIITTSDGSHSLRNKQLNETYHSTHGAIRESLHVFIQNGLTFVCGPNIPAHLSIFEVGFGTGLNALLTLEGIDQFKIPCHYTSIEGFPLDRSIVAVLNYPAELRSTDASSYFERIHACPWDEVVRISPYFELEKINSKLEDVTLGTGKFDLIFFDAFAPSKQPEMWDLSVLKKIEQSMNAGAVFVTYCAKGQLKRDLRSLGLHVETLPGPPGKKEMVRAIKPF